MNERKMTLWTIKYTLLRHPDLGVGSAVAGATNPDEACMLLKTTGAYNGTPEEYIIEEVEEIYASCFNAPHPALVFENGYIKSNIDMSIVEDRPQEEPQGTKISIAFEATLEGELELYYDSYTPTDDELKVATRDYINSLLKGEDMQVSDIEISL